MPEANVVLFEDHHLTNMQPTTLTRPAFAVTGAVYALQDIAALLPGRLRFIVRDVIRPIAERLCAQAEPAPGPTLFLNASLVPDVRYLPELERLLSEGQPCLCISNQRVAAAVLPAGADLPTDLSSDTVAGHLLEQNLPLRDAPFCTYDYPFDIVRHLYDIFPANLAHKLAADNYEEVREGVFAGKAVSIADTAVFRTEEGPVLLDDGVQVMDFTYFNGPVHVGPKSRITERSSIKDCTSVGHTCKIGGEVEASVVEAYSNKQHHGFLGHAWVGSWVNLGAGTSNSDLKNTYGDVRIVHRGEKVETGMQFFGCAVGDFAKTAINTSIFTGKVVGVNSMLYGYVGQNVPSFCNYAKSFGQITEVPLETAASTQKRMFARRGVEQTPEDVALLSAIYEMTREERSLSTEPLIL